MTPRLAWCIVWTISDESARSIRARNHPRLSRFGSVPDERALSGTAGRSRAFLEPPMTTKRKPTRRGASTDDVPYIMRLPDGRSILVLLRPDWCELDVTGELLLKPDAVQFLDRIRVMATKLPKAPSPSFIRTLRETLGLTQVELGERVGVDSMTVSRWERGAVKPSAAAVKALNKLRRDAGRRGITIAA